MSDQPSTSGAPPAKQPKIAAVPSTSKAPSPHAILVNKKQKGNPLLKHIKNLPWEYADIVPDYVMGASVCALFLSIRYHQLNTDYIHERLKLLGKAYDLRVLLVQIDVPDPTYTMKQLTRISILADLTLMLAWSAEDAGKMIETYKSFENKPPDMIMERPDSNLHSQIVNALTTIRSVNKTDALTLLRTFGTLEGIADATISELSLCPGFGVRKAERLYKVLREPFLYNSPENPVPSTSSADP